MTEVEQFILRLEEDHLPLSAVWLFGSYAKGTTHRWSDIDVCVVSTKFRQPLQALDYLWQRRPHDSGLTIEPIGVHPKDFRAGSSLLAEIQRTGIRVR